MTRTDNTTPAANPNPKRLTHNVHLVREVANGRLTGDACRALLERKPNLLTVHKLSETEWALHRAGAVAYRIERRKYPMHFRWIVTDASKGQAGGAGYTTPGPKFESLGQAVDFAQAEYANRVGGTDDAVI